MAGPAHLEVGDLFAKLLGERASSVLGGAMKSSAGWSSRIRLASCPPEIDVRVLSRPALGQCHQGVPAVQPHAGVVACGEERLLANGRTGQGSQCPGSTWSSHCVDLPPPSGWPRTPLRRFRLTLTTDQPRVRGRTSRRIEGFHLSRNTGRGGHSACGQRRLSERESLGRHHVTCRRLRMRSGRRR